MKLRTFVIALIVMLIPMTGFSQSWESKGLTGSYVTALAVNASGTVFAGTERGFIYRSNTGGSSWEKTSFSASEASVTAIDINSEGIIFAATYYDGIFRSSDNGDNWEQVITFDYPVYCLTINSVDYIFAGAGAGTILVSTDNGNSWQNVTIVPNEPDFAVLVIEARDSRVFAGTHRGIYVTENDGETWSTRGGLGNHVIKALANTSKIFAGNAGGGGKVGGDIFSSEDEGHSFSKILAGNSGLICTAMTVNQDWIFAARTDGVLISKNNGATWVPTNAGLTNLEIQSLAAGRDVVYAGTGNGVFSFVTGTIEPVPDVPVLVWPLDGEENVSVVPVLQWNPANRAITYTLELSNNASFTNPARFTTSNTELGLSLAPTTTYWWRVWATNTAGDGPTSDVWSFSTGPEPATVPDAPSPVSPPNGASHVPWSPATFEWLPAARAIRYTLEYWSDPSLGRSRVTTTETRYIGPLKFSEIYTWRVWASNNAGDGPPSPEWTFVTGGTGECASMSLTPTSGSFGPNGGDGSFRVTAGAACPWSVSTNDSWIRITGGGGQGSGDVTFSVDPSSIARQGNIAVIGFGGHNRSFVISQSGVSCGAGRSVTIGSNTATTGERVSVPVLLNAVCEEHALSLSLHYDTGILSAPSVSMGSDLSGGQLVVNDQAPGQLGVLATLPTGGVFQPGQREVFVVSFQTGHVDQSTATTIAFGNTPVKYLVVDRNGQFLEPVEWRAGLVTVLPRPFGYEGDVAPRPNGNNDGTVDVGDWVQEGRFVARLDVPQTPNEFQRADCAPKNTLGDGQLTVSDYTQVGRYAANLDAVVRAGGPTGAALKTADLAVAASVTVRMVDTAVQQGELQKIPVEILSLGEVNALSFSLAFDTNIGTATVALDSSITSAATLVTNYGTQGQVGVIVGKSPGAAFGAGTKSVIVVSFMPVRSSRSTTLQFGDSPIPRGVADVNANTLEAIWRVDPSTQVADGGLVPEQFRLFQNYPNPFNPETEIRYVLATGGTVRLTIYNTVGVEIRKLVNTSQGGGEYSVVWDGRDEKGGTAPSGVYYYRLEAAECQQIRKMVLIR